MTDTQRFQDEFWAALREHRTGLLSVRSAGAEHVAPMTAHFDARGPLYFYAPASGVLATHIAAPHDGRFFYVDPAHHLFASAAAALTIEPDAALRARFWSAEVEAWFPGGPEQEGVALLRCELGEAQVWLGAGPHETHAQDRDQRAHVAL